MKKVLLAAASFVAAGTAHAAPTIGDTVTCGGDFACSSSTATVSGSREFTLAAFGTTYLAADFSDGLVTVSNVYSGFSNTFNAYGYSIIFADQTRPFTQATLKEVTGVSNFSQSNLTFNNGVLRIFIGSPEGPTEFSANSSFVIQLGSVAAVPEPATWAMMLIGLGIVAGAARYRRRATAVTFA